MTYNLENLWSRAIAYDLELIPHGQELYSLWAKAYGLELIAYGLKPVVWNL